MSGPTKAQQAQLTKIAELEAQVAALTAAQAEAESEGSPPLPALDPATTYPLDPNINVAVAIARVMAELPAIGKGGTAPSAMGGFSFRRIEDITAVAQKLMAKHGVVIIPKATETEVFSFTTTSDNGKVTNWTDTRVLYNYTILGPDLSAIEAATYGIGRDNFDKGSGKAATTAYKIMLLQTFCIGDSNMDIDAQETAAHTNDTNGRTFGTGQEPPPPMIDWHALGWAEAPIPTDASGTAPAKAAREKFEQAMKDVKEAMITELDEDMITKLLADRAKSIGPLPLSVAKVRTWEAMVDAAIRDVKGEPDVEGAMGDAFPGSQEADPPVDPDQDPA